MHCKPGPSWPVSWHTIWGCARNQWHVGKTFGTTQLSTRTNCKLSELYLFLNYKLVLGFVLCEWRAVNWVLTSSWVTGSCCCRLQQELHMELHWQSWVKAAAEWLHWMETPKTPLLRRSSRWVHCAQCVDVLLATGPHLHTARCLNCALRSP